MAPDRAATDERRDADDRGAGAAQRVTDAWHPEDDADRDDGIARGQEHDVGLRQQRFPGGDFAHQGGEVVIRDTETRAIALLQDDVLAQFRGDPFEMQGVDGEAAFVRFSG